jgi:hypothetical protein
LYTEGLPKDGIYSIVSWPVTQKAPGESLKGVILDSSGQAICAGTPGTCVGNKPDDPIDLVFRPLPGEPVRIGLVSADGATRAFAKIVPVPLRGEDHGCSVEAVLLAPASEVVLIEGSGFPAKSELAVDSDSEGERQSRKHSVDADGRYSSAMLPYNKRATGHSHSQAEIGRVFANPESTVGKAQLALTFRADFLNFPHIH